jgi:hypothetical protein
MKTIIATGPLLIAVNNVGSSKKKVHVTCVRYETYEMSKDEFEATSFKIHDANCAEAKIIAELVKD